MIDVRVAGPDDVAKVAISLGRAFADDPIFEFILPDAEPEERSRRATPFFVADTRIRVRTASAWTTPDRVGAALWAPPGKWRPSLADGLRLAWPIVRGARSRSFRVIAALSNIDKVHPRQPHWYLAVLGTDPDHQGKGVGSALMAPVLQRCDADGVPAYLESSKESNIGYYERFGFRVERELPLGKGAPSVWPMWRDPQAPEPRE